MKKVGRPLILVNPGFTEAVGLDLQSDFITGRCQPFICNFVWPSHKCPWLFLPPNCADRSPVPGPEPTLAPTPPPRQACPFSPSQSFCKCFLFLFCTQPSGSWHSRWGRVVLRHQTCPCLHHPHTQHLPEINHKICKLQGLKHKVSSVGVNYRTSKLLSSWVSRRLEQKKNARQKIIKMLRLEDLWLLHCQK